LLKRPVGKRQSGRRTRAGALERRGWQEGRRYRSWRTSRSIRRPEAARSNARIQFPRSFNHFECASSLEPLVSSPVVLFLSLSLYIYIERERERDIYIYISLSRVSQPHLSALDSLSLRCPCEWPAIFPAGPYDVAYLIQPHHPRRKSSPMARRALPRPHEALIRAWQADNVPLMRLDTNFPRTRGEGGGGGETRASRVARKCTESRERRHVPVRRCDSEVRQTSPR